MNKNEYVSPDLELIRFKLKDVIMNSIMIVNPEDTATGGDEGTGDDFGGIG